MILTSAIRRLAAAQWLNNLAIYATAPFLGGLIVQQWKGGIGHPNHHVSDS